MITRKIPKPSFTPGPYYVREGEDSLGGYWAIRSMADDSEIARVQYPHGNAKLRHQAQANARFLAMAERMYPVVKALLKATDKIPLRKRPANLGVNRCSAAVIISNIEIGELVWSE